MPETIVIDVPALLVWLQSVALVTLAVIGGYNVLAWTVKYTIRDFKEARAARKPAHAK